MCLVFANKESNNNTQQQRPANREQRDAHAGQRREDEERESATTTASDGKSKGNKPREFTDGHSACVGSYYVLMHLYIYALHCIQIRLATANGT